VIGNDDNFHAVGELEVRDLNIQGAGWQNNEEEQGKVQGGDFNGAHGWVFPVL
jgi:hypothetical protein